LDAVSSNKWEASYNTRAGGWIVQRYGQVVGNIARAATLREAIDAARKETKEPTKLEMLSGEID
jgi:hypothetical protein